MEGPWEEDGSIRNSSPSALRQGPTRVAESLRRVNRHSPNTVLTVPPQLRDATADPGNLHSIKADSVPPAILRSLLDQEGIA